MILEDEKIKLFPIDAEFLKIMYYNITSDTQTSLKVFNRIFAGEPEFINYFNNTYFTGEHQFFSIYNKKSQEIIGYAGLSEIDCINRHCNIHIYIFKQINRGRALGVYALQQLAEYVFEILRFNKIMFCVSAANKQVSRLAHRFGCRTAGVFKLHIFSKFTGKYESLVIFEILKSEYKRVI